MTPYISPCPYCGISFAVEWSETLPALPVHTFVGGLSGMIRPCSGGGKPLELEALQGFLSQVQREMSVVAETRDDAQKAAARATLEVQFWGRRLKELEKVQDGLLLALEKL